MIRVFALLFHLLQVVISLTAGVYVSMLVAAVVTGAFFNDFATIRRIFRMSPLLLSIVGTIVWLVVVLIEFSLMESAPTPV